MGSEDYSDDNHSESNSVDYSMGSSDSMEDLDADLVEKEEKLAKKVARAFARLGLKEVKEDGDAPTRLVPMGEEEEFDFGDSFTGMSEEEEVEEITPGGRRIRPSNHWKT